MSSWAKCRPGDEYIRKCSRICLNDLAHLEYQKGRLVRQWTHLERQRGGAGFMGGPGETQIEADRREIQSKILGLKRELEKVRKTRSLHRAQRRKVPHPIVALVGYTNAGKSTLFNKLTNADVYAEDQLFATLDPTMRKLNIAGLNDVVLVDTVGFVSALPHALVEAFKATLEEVVYADLLLHVVDGADPQALERVQQVRAVLSDIGIAPLGHALDDSHLVGEEGSEEGSDKDNAQTTVPELLVINKIDQLDSDQLRQLQVELGVGQQKTCAISSLTGQGLEALSDAVGEALGVVAPHEVLLDPADGKTRAWLYRSGAVLSERPTEDGSLSLLLQADDYVIGRLRNQPGVALRQCTAVPKIST